MTAEDNPLVIAIRNLEGKVSVAKDKATFYRQRADLFDREALKYSTAIEAICEVIGLPREGLSQQSAPPDPEAEALKDAPEGVQDAFAEAAAAKEAAVEEPVQPFPAAAAAPPRANGLDRALVQRELSARNIYYPLAFSHRKASHFVRQSLITACVHHPNWFVYLENGGFNLLDTHMKRKRHIDHALEVLQIDRQKVVDDARAIHTLILKNGVQGTDYL